MSDAIEPTIESAPKAKQRNNGPLLAVGALLIAGAALAFIAWGNLGQNLIYYWTPKEMLEQGEKAYGPTIRLGGVVVPGTIVWNDAHTSLTFDVGDSPAPDAAKVHVDCKEVPPQMFREGIGVVVEGSFSSSKVFTSNRLMVSHSNEYRPPKPGEDPKKWMKSLAEESQASR